MRDCHAARGAVFMTLQGMDIVQTYGDLDSEARALHTGAALMDFSWLGQIWLRGKDAQGYLHRQTSRNVQQLAVGHGVHAVHMRGDGKLVGEMILHRVREQEFLALTMPACADGLAAAFDRFIFTEDCRVERPIGDTGVISVLGPHSSELMRDHLGHPTQEAAEFSCAVATGDGAETLVIHTGIAGVPGYHLMASAERLVSLWEALASLGAVPVGWDAINRSRIEAGIPLFGFDHDETWVPNDAGLECALDFTKGCFPGQEVVAKIKNLSHPRQLLRGFVFDQGAPPAGSPLFERIEQVGTVTSACESLRLGKAIGLGHLKWRFKDIEGNLRIGTDGEFGTATPVSLPFPS